MRFKSATDPIDESGNPTSPGTRFIQMLFGDGEFMREAPFGGRDTASTGVRAGGLGTAAKVAYVSLRAHVG